MGCGGSSGKGTPPNALRCTTERSVVTGSWQRGLARSPADRESRKHPWMACLFLDFPWGCGGTSMHPRSLTVLEMKCFWLRGFAFRLQSLEVPQEPRRPLDPSVLCFLASPRKTPRAWSHGAYRADSPQRTVSVAGLRSMASPGVSPGSGQSWHLTPFAQTTVLPVWALCVPSCAGHCGETGGSAQPQTFNHRRFHFLLLVVESS